MSTDAVLNKALISLYRMRNNAPDAIRGLPRTHAGKPWREVAATLSPQDAVWLLRCCNPGLPPRYLQGHGDPPAAPRRREAYQ